MIFSKKKKSRFNQVLFFLFSIFMVMVHCHNCGHGNRLNIKKSYQSYNDENEKKHNFSLRNEKRHLRETNSVDSNPTYQPIRITPYYDEDNIDLSNDLKTLLRTRLVPDIISYWSAALSVIPVQSPLLVDGVCKFAWDTTPTVCAELQTPSQCIHMNIPQDHIKSTRVCTSCSGTNCSSRDSACTFTPQGKGVNNSDYVLYVQATYMDICGTEVVGFGGPCQTDQYDRPTFGMVNFCPNKMQNTPESYDELLTLGLHEIGHALGFTADLFSYMRDQNGIPRTPRDSNGNPISSSVACPNKNNNNMLSSNSFVMPSTNTIQIFNERGHKVAKFVTPKILAYVRNHFDCSSLNGAELASDNNSCLGSHWSERMFGDEFMTPVLSYTNVFSGLTLAYFDDSGWYKVNYSSAADFTWGARKGCSFVTEKCLALSSNGNQPTPIDPESFCTLPTEIGCHSDLKSIGYCTAGANEQGQLPIPSYFQYFSDPKKGGFSSADFCPIYSGYQYGDCRDPQNAYAGHSTTKANFFGETYCPTCRCAIHSLKSIPLSRTWYFTSISAGCFNMICRNNNVIIRIPNENGNSVDITCTKKGEVFSVEGYTGTIICPDPLLVCNSYGNCIPQCTANQECLGGKCVCIPGYSMNDSTGICTSDCPYKCSEGKGSCNSKTHQCDCFTGYTGNTCSNLISCPTPCPSNQVCNAATMKCQCPDSLPNCFSKSSSISSKINSLDSSTTLGFILFLVSLLYSH